MVGRSEQYYPLWDEQTESIVKSVVEDFVFLDHRLATHPKVHVYVEIYLKNTGYRTLLRRDMGMVWEKAILSLPGVINMKRFARPGDHLIDSRLEVNVVDLPVDIVHKLNVPLRIFADRSFGEILLATSDRTLKLREKTDSGHLFAALISYVYIRADNEAKHFWYPALENLGHALQSTRKSLGLSQAALAQQMGQSRIALSQWERGRQPPSLGPLF